jgi:hypothetical protein
VEAVKVAGIDLSTHAVDVVLVPLDGNEPPQWRRYPLDGPSSFDRARTVRDAMPPRTGGLWDDVLAIGIEDPRGHAAGHAYRIQGAILSCLPQSVLVQPWIPSAWRKAVGLPGNASKDDVAVFTGQHRGDMLDVLRLACRDDDPFVDLRLWGAAQGGRVWNPDARQMIGIKGMPGRAGIGIGHRPRGSWPKDRDLAVLRRWIGDDAEAYAGFAKQ